ncbi:cyclodeaminase/cyclohydrolase family protein [uncultured Fretibacterium sp.]|uniref:cyclodeaminase/cyclohydrolase family protein n=1 Tax=uncultured Fretibacterium sp. TaxID=1678694 RepID=UPI002627D000|nr:cyclodeaminase/cyclohydrolase family protein [uncultured Fretibacterium sp.]
MKLTDLSLKDFTAKLGSDAPAPGGGSAAALSGALGAALVSMVCNLTKGREKYAEFETLVVNTLKESDELAAALLEGIQKDTNAFDGVIAAYGMPKGTDAEKAARSEAIQNAYKVAILSPEETADNCLAVMRLSKDLLHKSNKNAASDLAVSALQAYAGLIGALENVAINLGAIKDQKYVNDKRKWMELASDEGEKLLKEVREGVRAMLA